MATITQTTNVGLSEQEVRGVADILNSTLADEVVLYIKTRNYHWNVVGRRFHTLHEIFEEQYEELAKIGDETAEFTRYFGAKALGTMVEFGNCTRLKEQPGDYPSADRMVDNLREDHETLIRHLREDIDEAQDKHHAADVADFLTGLLEKHEKMAWMLRSLNESH